MKSFQFIFLNVKKKKLPKLGLSIQKISVVYVTYISAVHTLFQALATMSWSVTIHASLPSFWKYEG